MFTDLSLSLSFPFPRRVLHEPAKIPLRGKDING